MLTKVCTMCSTEKTIDCFPTQRRGKYGVSSWCKPCCADWKRAYKKTAKGRAVYKAAEKKWRHSEKGYTWRTEERKRYTATKKGKEVMVKAVQKHREKNKDFYKANYLFNNAVKGDHIIKQPCQECGAIKAEGHHPDYSKPLEVVWLCRKHHRTIEGKPVYHD